MLPAEFTTSASFTVAAVGGIATFANLELNTPGIGYQLSASADANGLPLGGTSDPFDVQAGTYAPWPHDVVVTPSVDSLPIGEQLQLSATAYDAVQGVEVAGTFQWLSSDPSIADVDATGLVTAIIRLRSAPFAMQCP